MSGRHTPESLAATADTPHRRRHPTGDTRSDKGGGMRPRAPIDFWSALLLIGLPVGLVRLTGWPLPAAPSRADLAAWVAEPLTYGSITATMVILAWLTWLILLGIAIVEVCRWLARRRRLPRLHIPQPAQMLTATLVGTAAVSSTAGAATVADTGGPAVTADEGNHTRTVAATPPSVQPAPATVHVGSTSYRYVVKPGDTLSKISRDWLGTPGRWPQICRLNHHRHFPTVGGTLRDCDLIYPGWDLRLPTDARPPADATPVRPAPPARPAPKQNPAPPDPDGVVEPHPSPARTTPSSPNTAGPAAPQTAGDCPQHRSDNDNGVAIPNGWLTTGLAAALVAAAAGVWLRRRHRYDPRTTPDPAADPSLQPLPATVTRLRREVRRQSPHLLQAPDPGPTVREYVQMDPKPALPEPGPHGSQLAGWGPLPAGGLGLAGPGAAGAARAMLVATLSAGHAYDPDAEATVVVPASVLADLAGDPAVVDLAGSIPRLIITPGLSEAVTHLHRENLDRAWILDQHDVHTVTELRTRFPGHEPLPPVLLIADIPEPATRTRLSTILEMSDTVGIGAVLLGDWPAGTTVQVDPDGSTTGGDGQRLSTLDQTTMMESLALLREAHTGEPATATQKPSTPHTDTSRTPHPAAPTASTSTASTPAPHDQALAADEPGSKPEKQVAATSTSTSGPSRKTATVTEARSPAPHAADRDGPDLPGGAKIRVSVQVLGRVAIIKPDGTEVTGLRRKAAELLLYLATHRGGAAIDDIKEALWPDAPMSRAKERLATDVANLRASLRAGAGITPQQEEPNPAGTGQRKPARGGRKPAGPEFVINPGGRYILAPDLVDIDWWRVCDAVAEARTAADTPARRAALERAVGGFGGLLYDADGTYEWANVDVEISRRHGVTAHAQLADLVGPQQPERAARYLQTAADLDPINEELAVAAMRAHAATADINAIRARFSRLSRALLDTGQEPAEETAALAAQLCRDVAVREPRPAPEEPPRGDDLHR
ncbi:BTAD domain-containing putative transcriptional regulator [Phytohabitans sp. LJ34]|uniref:BTAD domain-containing putative transcriptional regulator n=1 Tax=Phytohabitans sp. LJ34 TaxID=3452217 RepID=UPI003F8B0482